MATTLPLRLPVHRSCFVTMRRIAARPVLGPGWDAVLRTCAGVAVVTAIGCAVFPVITELVVFGWLMFVTNGPTGTFLPSASEPLLMAFGKLHPPLLLAGIGVLGLGLVESLNFRVFGAVLNAPRVSGVRRTRVIRTVQGWFELQPFSTTVVTAMTPIPFWVARTCAVVSDYPMSRFIVATAIGRFPRIWLIALLGSAVPLSTGVILGGGGLLVLAGGCAVAIRRRQARWRSAPARRFS